MRLVPLTLMIVMAGTLGAAPPPRVAMHPDRQLDCVLARATNLDPSKDQNVDEVEYEGRHRFALRLSRAPVRLAPPPDPSDAPDPVDPETRILADPDSLSYGVPQRFDRVVDLWPERVELLTAIPGAGAPQFNLIIINPIDTKAGTANLFMTRALDAASLDLERAFLGQCKVTARAG